MKPGTKSSPGSPPLHHFRTKAYFYPFGRPKRPKNTAAKRVLIILFLAVTVVVVISVSFHANTAYHTVNVDILDFPSYLSYTPSAKHNEKPGQIFSGENHTKNNESSCFRWNSQAWLDGPRLGNDRHISEEFALEMVLDTLPLLSEGSTMPLMLQQSLCHEDSRFLNWTDEGDDEKSVHFWSLRLMYLAFHIHQHIPAAEEAMNRLSCGGSCVEKLQKRNIGNFDFECPDAKFLVVPVGTSGLGAVMRLGIVNGLIAGFAANRTVVFVSNSPVGPRWLRRPWAQASCDRRDLQCFYLPLTPCVLTELEIKEAYILQRSEQRNVFKLGTLPPEHNDTRVIIADFVMRPQKFPETFRPRMLSVVSGFIDHLRKRTPGDPRIPVLQRAAQLVLEIEREDPLRPFYYTGSISKVHHAALFFAMRPNQLATRKLDAIMQRVFPKDFNTDYTLGLPIRASDKCLIESECLSFDQHMKLMGRLWTENQELIRTELMDSDSVASGPIGNIVLTSESELIHHARVEFENNSSLRTSVPFDFRFVTNEQDVMQGTGLPLDYGLRSNVTADEVMLSAVGAIKMQLMARFTVGNCCSNFHLLLFDFLRDGCGAARDNIGQCLQENDDPEFRVCCSWSKTEECQAKRASREAIADLHNISNSAQSQSSK